MKRTLLPAARKYLGDVDTMTRPVHQVRALLIREVCDFVAREVGESDFASLAAAPSASSVWNALEFARLQHSRVQNSPDLRSIYAVVFIMFMRCGGDGSEKGELDQLAKVAMNLYRNAPSVQ